MNRSRARSRYIEAFLAPTLWFLCLSLLYALATVVCALKLRQTGLYGSLAIIVLTLVGLFWIVRRARRGADPFSGALSETLAWLCIMATLWLGVPLATQAACTAH